MAATFEWVEHNGAGAVETTGRTDVNWKSVDDATSTAYSAAPLATGTQSYEKWQFGRFSGTWTSITNVMFEHTATAVPANVELWASIQPTYSQPDTDDPSAKGGAGNAAWTNISTVGNFASPRFSNIRLITNSTDATIVPADATSNGGSYGAWATSVTSAANPPDYACTEYCVTQLKVGASAGAGNIGSIQLTLRYDEA